MESDSYRAALIVQVLIAGIFAALLLSCLISNEHTADSVERHEKEVAYIKTASSRVNALIGKAEDKKANKEIEKAYDTLHSSPSKTIVAVRSIESNVMHKVAELEGAVFNQDTIAIITTARDIVALIEERNREIRLSQHSK